MPTGTLEGRGKKLYEQVYDASVSSGDSKEIASKKAWGAVKRAGWKKDEKGNWVKTEKSEALSELSLTIHKVSVDKSAGGTMRWRAVASDTSPDLYDESMSDELFDDFIYRIENNVEIPEQFKSVLHEDWKGGMPYLSISHYKSGTSGRNIPGMPEKIYRDGNRLKAVGVLHDSPLGHAVFKTLCDDLYSEKANQEGKVRISIGFLDLAHKHSGEGNTPDFLFERKSIEDACPMCQSGVGNKVYVKGQLVHLALTRVPVNPRTDMEVSKSMVKTRKEDAASIVGKDLAETLEEKSLLPNYLVVKSDKPEEAETDKSAVGLPGQEAGTGISVLGNSMTPANTEELQAHANDNYDEEELEGDVQDDADDKLVDARPIAKAKIASDKKSEELTYDEPDETKREERRNRPAGEKSLLEKSFDDIHAKVMELKSQNVPAETALREIQPLYNVMGEVIKKSFEPEMTPNQPANSELAELMNVVKGLAETVSTMQQTMSTEIATLKAQTLAGVQVKKSDIPAPRSMPATSPLTTPAPVRQKSQIEELAYKSTFMR